MIVIEIPLFINELTHVCLPKNHKILSVNVVNNTPMLNVLDIDESGTENKNTIFDVYKANEVIFGKREYVASCVIFNRQYHIFKM